MSQKKPELDIFKQMKWVAPTAENIFIDAKKINNQLSHDKNSSQTKTDSLVPEEIDVSEPEWVSLEEWMQKLLKMATQPDHDYFIKLNNIFYQNIQKEARKAKNDKRHASFKMVSEFLIKMIADIGIYSNIKILTFYPSIEKLQQADDLREWAIFSSRVLLKILNKEMKKMKKKNTTDSSFKKNTIQHIYIHWSTNFAKVFRNVDYNEMLDECILWFDELN